MVAEQIIVVALGGNAILRKGDKGYPEEMWRNVYRAVEPIVDLYLEGYGVVVTHGNGPQVGNILEWFERAKDVIPPLTMDIATAMSQGWIGYMLQQAIGNAMVKRGIKRKVITILNQVLVNPLDPAFKEPEKPVGPWYQCEHADELARERGWVFKRDPRGGCRRVVPSPEPLDNLEAEAIKELVSRGYVVIASGGGGIPVYDSGNAWIRGIEAVVDKDLASSLLAIKLEASRFIILTDVEYVYIDYSKATAKPIKRIKAYEALKLLEAGIFPRGSMEPKVRASATFTIKTHRQSIIGSLDKASEVFKEESGTIIEP
jgi:carbamate kinase